MVKSILTGLFASGLFIATADAQSAKEKEAIKSLCGCYEVDFKYAETFGHGENYKPSEPYHVGGLEYVVAEESSDKKWVIQHLLVIDDSTVIKHWREDWEYEKNNWLVFNHDATWTRKTGTAPKGQWTQTVWEVDDAPRYQGSSNWVSSNGKYLWENTTDAPLPRREYTKRNDYNVMERTNRIELTATGWMHEQDNKKILRKNGQQDSVLAEEKGYNNYVKVDNSKCAAAVAFWKEHHEFWNAVRTSWEEVLGPKKAIHLEQKANGKRLGQQLEALEAEHLTGTALKTKLKEVLDGYISQPDGKSVATITSGK